MSTALNKMRLTYKYPNIKRKLKMNRSRRVNTSRCPIFIPTIINYGDTFSWNLMIFCQKIGREWLRPLNLPFSVQKCRWGVHLWDLENLKRPRKWMNWPENKNLSKSEIETLSEKKLEANNIFFCKKILFLGKGMTLPFKV